MLNSEKQLTFIAELSGNHKGSLDRALQIVEASAAAGATHFKLQTYSPDSLTMNLRTEPYLVNNGHPLWAGRSLYDLYSEGQTPREWHGEIFNYAESLGLVPFSTPFDEDSARFLFEIGARLFKIASLEIVDIPLIEAVSSFGLPIIMSTGAASLEEIETAVSAARSQGCEDITLLLCTSDYPADPEDSNLARIPFMIEHFQVSVGLSDHTIGSEVANLAVACGARVFEKHVTLDSEDGALDSGFSATPEQFRDMVLSCERALRICGHPDTWNNASEDTSRNHRPSIIFTRDVSVGQVLSMENVATLRPNIGLPPAMLPEVLGRRIVTDARAGDGLSEEHLGLSGN